MMTSSDAVFRLEVVSPEGELFSGDAKAVHVRGKGGALGIYPGHLQLLAALIPGAVRIETQDEDAVLYVSGGTIEVQPTVVTILADTAERPENVNVAAAEAAKAAAEAI